MTEPLTTLITFLAVLLALIAHQERSTRLALLSGCVLGSAVFCRIDASLGVAVAGGAALWAITGDSGARRRAAWMLGGFGVLAAAAWADAWVHATGYLMDLWATHFSKLCYASFGAAFASLALLAVAGRLPSDRARERAVRAVMVLSVAGLGGWLAYAWFVRAPSGDDFAHRAIREVAFYSSWPAFPLAWLGMAAVVARKRWSWLPLVCLAGLALFVFTWTPAIAADHIWASRRWVPYVLPVLMLFSVEALHALYARLRGRWRLLALAAAALVAADYGANAWQTARPFAFTSILDGIVDDYVELADVLRSRDRKIVFTDTQQVASILTYVYGIPTVYVREPWNEDLARAIQGHTVVTRHGDNRWVIKRETVTVGGQFLEIVRGRRPVNLYNRTYWLNVGVASPAAPDLRPIEPRHVPRTALHTVVGRRDPKTDVIHTTGTGGTLQFGPYFTLEPGIYIVKYFGKVRAGGDVGIDCASDKGTRSLGARWFVVEPSERPQTIATVAFTLDEPIEDAEFRMRVGPEVDLSLWHFELYDFTP